MTVDSRPGEKILYSYFRHGEARIENNKIIMPNIVAAISCRAYFENGDFLWDIRLEAVAERSEQARADFEHIIGSFKFIE
jgi:hypothetical protein